MYPRFRGYHAAIVFLIAVLFNIVTSAQQVPARSDSSVTSTSKYALGHILVKFRGQPAWSPGPRRMPLSAPAL